MTLHSASHLPCSSAKVAHVVRPGFRVRALERPQGGSGLETRERKDYDVRRADPPSVRRDVQRAAGPHGEDAGVPTAHFRWPTAEDVRRARTTPMKFEQINAVERQKVAVQAKEVQTSATTDAMGARRRDGYAERKAGAPAEHKVETPAEHKGPETPAEHKGPVTPAEHKVETPAEHRGRRHLQNIRSGHPAEHRSRRRGAQGRRHQPNARVRRPEGTDREQAGDRASSEVHVTAPEKVKIPPAPIAHKTDQPSPREGRADAPG